MFATKQCVQYLVWMKSAWRRFKCINFHVSFGIRISAPRNWYWKYLQICSSVLPFAVTDGDDSPPNVKCPHFKFEQRLDVSCEIILFRKILPNSAHPLTHDTIPICITLFPKRSTNAPPLSPWPVPLPPFHFIRNVITWCARWCLGSRLNTKLSGQIGSILMNILFNSHAVPAAEW